MIEQKLMKEALNLAAMALALHDKSEFLQASMTAIEFGATAKDFSKVLDTTEEMGEELIRSVKPLMK